MRIYFFSEKKSSFNLMSLILPLFIILINTNNGYSQPVAICQDITVSADYSCLGEVTFKDVDNGSYDPSGRQLRYRIWPQGPFDLGTNTTNLTVQNSSGESDICQSQITVIDDSGPSFTVNCPEVIKLCGPQNVFWQPPVAEDNCGIVTMTSSNNPGDFCEVGTSLISYTFIDEVGNTSSCNFEIIIVDPFDCRRSAVTGELPQNHYIDFNEINVYPNPSSEKLNIKYTSNKEALINISIYDMKGARQLVIEQEVFKGLQNIELTINNLTSGMYTVRIIDGSDTYLIPFIKTNSI